MIIWDDSENDGNGFTEWTPAKHPVYGDIEIGGFDPKFFSQNPPAKHLEKWIKNQAMFNLEMVKYLPELVWDKIESKKIRSYKADSADFRLKVSFRNSGKLPTALKQAHLVKIVTDDRVTLELDTTGLASGKPAYRIIEETKPAPSGEGRRGYGDSERPVQRRPVSKAVPYTDGGAVTTAEFEIRLYGRTELSGKAGVYSTRGGILKDREFVIK